MKEWRKDLAQGRGWQELQEGAGESYWDPDKQAKVWRRQLASARNQLNQEVQEQRLKSHGMGIGGGGRRQGKGSHGSPLLPRHTEAGICSQVIQLKTAWPVHSLVALGLLS